MQKFGTTLFIVFIKHQLSLICVFTKTTNLTTWQKSDFLVYGKKIGTNEMGIMVKDFCKNDNFDKSPIFLLIQKIGIMDFCCFYKNLVVADIWFLINVIELKSDDIVGGISIDYSHYGCWEYAIMHTLFRVNSRYIYILIRLKIMIPLN